MQNESNKYEKHDAISNPAKQNLIDFITKSKTKLVRFDFTMTWPFVAQNKTHSSIKQTQLFLCQTER